MGDRIVFRTWLHGNGPLQTILPEIAFFLPSAEARSHVHRLRCRFRRLLCRRLRRRHFALDYASRIEFGKASLIEGSRTIFILLRFRLRLVYRPSQYTRIHLVRFRENTS